MKAYLEAKKKDIEVYTEHFKGNSMLSERFLQIKFNDYYNALKEQIKYESYKILRDKGYSIKEIEELEQNIADELSEHKLTLKYEDRESQLLDRVEKIEKISIECISLEQKLKEEEGIETTSFMDLVMDMANSTRNSESRINEIKSRLHKQKKRCKECKEIFKDMTHITIKDEIDKWIASNNYTAARRDVRRVTSEYKAQVKQLCYLEKVNELTKQAVEYGDTFISIYMRHLCNDTSKQSNPSPKRLSQVLQEKTSANTIINESMAKKVSRLDEHTASRKGCITDVVSMVINLKNGEKRVLSRAEACELLGVDILEKLDKAFEHMH